MKAFATLLLLLMTRVDACQCQSNLKAALKAWDENQHSLTHDLIKSSSMHQDELKEAMKVAVAKDDLELLKLVVSTLHGRGEGYKKDAKELLATAGSKCSKYLKEIVEK